MTQPNPFSSANSLEHLVNPKIVVGATGYQVAVDIANVDTYYGRQLGGSSGLQIQQAYIQQIGSTGSSGSAFFNEIGSTASSGQAYFSQIGSSGTRGDAYFNKIYWNILDPAITGGGGTGATLLGGPGILVQQSGEGQLISGNLQGTNGIQVSVPVSGPITIGYNAPNIIGSTGVGVSFSNNNYTLSSTLGIVGSQNIGVEFSGSTYTISYLGSQGGGGTITGVSGAYAVFGASGLTSSTVLTSRNVVGSTGQIMLYSSQGPTSSSLFSANVPGRTLTVPSTIIVDRIAYPSNAAYLRLTADTQSGYIQSGNVFGGSSSLNITGPYNTPSSNLTSFDIPNGKVTINPNYDYPQGIQSLVKGSVSGTTFFADSGATYNVYLYGGGGAGSSGFFSGGAGGFVQVLGITAGAPGITFSFNNLTNPNGGNSLEFLVNGITAAVAPGGGAGGSGGAGAAYGEPGGSYNGQGFSAIIDGVTGGTGGIYLNSQTNGTTGFNFRVGSPGITAQSGIFNNVQVTYGLTGYLSPGTKIRGYGVIPNVLGPTFATYYFPPGSTLIFQTNGITFENSLYSFTGITYGLVDLSNINTSSLTGTTFARQASGGTATVSGSIYEFQGGYIGGTFSGDGSGIDQMLVGSTFSVGLTGLTLTVNYGTIFEDYGITGGIQIDFSGGLTFSFSRSLGNTVAPLLRITDPIGISPNSIIQVQTQTIVYRGEDGGVSGGIFGGGGGFYGGGGGTGGAGGGAGGAFINTALGFTGSFGAGSGSTPYLGTYNANAAYGYGGYDSTGGTPYYVVEKIDPGVQPDVLQVNGNVTISGGLNVQNNTVISGSGNVLTTNGSILSSGAVQAPDFTGINPALTAVQAANFSQGISYTNPTLTIANSICSYPPVGSITMYIGYAQVPLGWLLCDGKIYTSAQYPSLGALLTAAGSPFDLTASYGGISTFFVPDLRSRVPIGIGNGTFNPLTDYSLGQTGGFQDSTLPAHTHTVNDPGHFHSNGGSAGGSVLVGAGANKADQSNTGVAQTGITLASEGISPTGTNLPPFLGVAFIIKT